MHHAISILFGPVNALLVKLLGSPENAPLWWRKGVVIGGFPVAGIAPLDEKGNAIGWIPDHVVMALLVLVLCAVFFPLASRSFQAEKPGGVQNVLELFVGFLRALVKDNIAHHPLKYLPLAGAFFFFIALSNLLGFFFFFQPPTANLNTTFALSLTCLVFFNASGFRAHGFFGYLRTLMGPSLVVAFLVFPIELIGNLARGLSLAMRLYGNIYGEHAATGAFTELLPVLVPWPLNALGLFTAFLQAYVFTLLTTVYIGQATSHDH